MKIIYYESSLHMQCIKSSVNEWVISSQNRNLPFNWWLNESRVIAQYLIWWSNHGIYSPINFRIEWNQCNKWLHEWQSLIIFEVAFLTVIRKIYWRRMTEKKISTEGIRHLTSNRRLFNRTDFDLVDILNCYTLWFVFLHIATIVVSI